MRGTTHLAISQRCTVHRTAARGDDVNRRSRRAITRRTDLNKHTHNHTAQARGGRSRGATSGPSQRPWWTWIQAVAVLAPVLSAVLVPDAMVANASSGTDYMDKATDPHGDIWLRGTTDGTTAGPLDPGTNPASATFGHL